MGIKLLAINFCGTKYDPCGSSRLRQFAGEDVGNRATKVKRLKFAVSETGDDLSVQLSRQFQRFSFRCVCSYVNLRLFMPDTH